MAEDEALAMDGPEALERPGMACSVGCEVVIKGGVVDGNPEVLLMSELS